MPNVNFNEINPNPIAFIFSENTLLSQKLLKKFTELKCKTFIFSRKGAKVLVNNNQVNIHNFQEIDAIYEKYCPNYIIKITKGDQLSDESEGHVFTKVLNIASKTQAKTIFTFPYGLSENLQNVVSDFIEKSFQYENLYIGFLYLGDIISENESNIKDSEFYKRLTDIKSDNTGLVGRRTYYPVFVNDLASEIVDQLLSISVYGNKLTLISEPLHLSQIGLNIKINYLRLFYENDEEKIVYPKVNVIKISPTASSFIKEKINAEFEKEKPQISEETIANHLPQQNVESKSEDKTEAQELNREKKPKLEPVVNKMPDNYLEKKTAPKPFSNIIQKTKKIKKPTFSFSRLKRIKNVNRIISFHAWKEPLKFKKNKENIRETTSGLQTKVREVKEMNNVSQKNKMSFKKPKLKKFSKKLLVVIFSLVLIVLIFPVVANITTKLINLSSRNLIGNGNFSLAHGLSKVTYHLIGVSKKQSLYFKDMGLLKSFYNLEFENSVEQEKVSEVNIYLSQALLKTTSVYSLENRNSNIIKKYTDISLDLDNLYQRLGFLEGETSGKDNYSRYYSKLFEINTNDFKNKIYLMSKLLSDSPFFLGQGEPKFYALVLQDNQVIRPNGGKITSIAIIKVSEGNLEEVNIYGVNFLDEKLEGFVEAPESLKKYFGEDYWQLAEANWYLDNKKTNEEIAWFLDKEIDIAIDGVVTLNRNKLKYLVDNFDSKKTDEEDKNLNLFSIDSDDFNDIVLLENIINLFPIKKSQSDEFLYYIVSAFSNREIVFYSYDNEHNKVLTDLGWDGQFNKSRKYDDCPESLLGIFETGMNKMSDSLIRKGQFELSFEENLVKKKFKYFLENPNNQDYQFYLRLLTDKESGLSPVSVYTKDAREDIDAITYGYDNYKEAGVYIEVGPGETKAIIFEWESYVESLSNKTGYIQTIIKQPGIDKFPLDVTISNPQDLEIIIDKSYSLTNDGAFVYNTEVTKDIKIEVFWESE